MKIKIESSANEKQRIDAVNSYEIVNIKKELFLDNLAHLVADICQTPIALISIIDELQQLIISKYGPVNFKSIKRSCSFDEQTLTERKFLEINDTLINPAFNKNSFITNEVVYRFYAGTPIVNPHGMIIGVLSVLDQNHKPLTEIQKNSLEIFSKSIMDFFILNKHKQDFRRTSSEQNTFFKVSPDLLCLATLDGHFKKISSAFITELGYTEEELLKTSFIDLIHEDDKEKTLVVLKDFNTVSDKVYFFKNRYLCKNGEFIWLNWNAVYDKNTNLIFATARNETELINLNTKLAEQKEKEILLHKEKVAMLSQLAQRISNELLNPINLVVGFSDVSLELLSEVADQLNTEDKDVKLNQVRLDLLKINDYGHLIFNVIKRMNTDASWKEVPSVVNGL